MMPMYARGYVTYGTVVATLIATLGDSAFVLIGAAVADSSFIAPMIAVHVISFVVGVIWGYIVDASGTTPSMPLSKFGPKFGEDLIPESDEEISPLEDLSREVPEGIGYKILHQGFLFWWVVTAIGFIFAVLLLIWSGQDADYELKLVYNPILSLIHI